MASIAFPKPGAEGTALHDETTVLRAFGADNMDADMGKIHPAQVVLSSEDKKSPQPHLSTFEDTLTTCEQVIVLTYRETKRSFVCALSTKLIRKMRPAPDSKPEMPSLDIKWFEAKIPPECVEKDIRPGAEGHSGIVGLNWGSEKGKQDKELRKSLRSQIADLANDNIKHKNF